MRQKIFFKRPAAAVLASALLLTGCWWWPVSDADLLKPAASPSVVFQQGNAAFSPQDAVMTDGASYFFSVQDIVGFLQLSAEQVDDKVLLRGVGGQTLELDTVRDTASLDGEPLKDYALLAYDKKMYLPLSETARLMQVWLGQDPRTKTLYVEPEGENLYSGIRVYAKARGTDFLFYQNDRWITDTLRGLNMGVTLPGQTVKNGDIGYTTYLAWFGQIANMNANSIRVYTLQSPAFYSALHDYNLKAARPLWLYQGLWIEQQGKLDKETQNKALRDARRLVDAVHGVGNVEGIEYLSDVSPWLGGWVIGSEWSADYIAATNQKSVPTHKGNYLYTKDNTPAFETLLCAIGDNLLSYQTKTYSLQAPLSFLNWPTTDTLSHPSEANPAEDAQSLNTELILPTAAYHAGLFALYHVYPTYPEFISQEGKTDGYAEYLERLFQTHTVPAMVGEYGASTARGMAHRSQDGRYSQGGLTEQQQGEQSAAMTRSIFESGFRGAMLFSWQDEWFKNVWNTRPQTASDRTSYWYNAQNCEQSYGIMGVFPGEGRWPVYLDGDPSEWEKEHLVANNPYGALYTQQDEGYLYLMLQFIKAQDEKGTLYIPISIDTESGLIASNSGNAHFEYNSQFLIEMRQDGGARLLVSATHDSYNLLYENGEHLQDGTFHPIYQHLRNAYTRPDTGEMVPLDAVETGLMQSGITNPETPEFYSLADYYQSGNCLEIRLPWMLIGFTDPSRLKVMSPLTEGGEIGSQSLDRLRIGFGYADGEKIAMTDCELTPWQDDVTFHQRLKQSYFVLQQVFEEYRLP